MGRALISVEDGKVQIHSRNHRDITQQFPELLSGEKAFRATNGLFDAEIVSLDAKGKPEFRKVINRLQSTGETVIQKLSKSSPVNCYIFDCLYLDGRSLVNDPLSKRKEWLRDVVRNDTPFRISESVEDGEMLFEAARLHELEGVMAKRKDGKYLAGRRSDLWLKIKVRQTAECIIIGYTSGKGNRGTTFGALHIADKRGEELHYRGKVGSGFDDATMTEIGAELKKLDKIKKPISNKVLDDKVTTWIEPKLFLEVSYSTLTPDKMYREPVFIRMRPDLGEDS
jgi:bifunctional non-homologous end joining protein LigD